MNRRLVLLAGGFTVITAGAVMLYLLNRPAPVTDWPGYAEADYVYVAPVLEGRLTSLAVARGDEVATGALLFTQDDADDLALRGQAAATLDQARAALANLQAT